MILSKEKFERVKDLTYLASELTIHEAAALVARIHERDAQSKEDRFSLYPVKDWGAFERLKKLEASHWTADEIEFSEDINDFNGFNLDERRPLLRAFGFFAVGDGSVAASIAYRMILIARTFEQQGFYICQLDNERVHGETYGKMIHTLVTDENERKETFASADKIESIKAMTQYIEDIFTDPEGDSDLLTTLACAEFLMFIPLFCIIFWYRAFKKGKIGRIILSNEQIAKDEALHCLNGCENYKGLPEEQRFTDQKIHQKIAHVVSLIDNFADETLSDVKLIDLTAENVKGYVRFVADSVLRELGHTTLYNGESPFPWMEFINLRNKTNFYEGTVAEYSRFNVKKAIQDAAKFSGLKVEDQVETKNVAKTKKGEILF